MNKLRLLGTLCACLFPSITSSGLAEIIKTIRTRLLGVVSVCVFGLAFLVSGAANASTIFAPTDGDINFITSTLSAGTLLAMFDDSDTSFVGSKLSIPVPETVSITTGGDNPGDYTATNDASATLNLTGAGWFILAISTDGGASWSGDTSFTALGANSYRVSFSEASVLEIDVRVVPVPASALLFGSGLLGLAGIARHKKVA